VVGGSKTTPRYGLFGFLILLALLGYIIYDLQASKKHIQETQKAQMAALEEKMVARLDQSDETTADVVVARERAEHLWNAIEALPEKLRLVVVLAGIEGHDMHEVSALLDVPEGTVKSRLFLARKQLKDRLSWMASSLR